MILYPATLLNSLALVSFMYVIYGIFKYVTHVIFKYGFTSFLIQIPFNFFFLLWLGLISKMSNNSGENKNPYLIPPKGKHSMSKFYKL